MTIDCRPTLAAPDDDPHLWLEEIQSEKPLAWVEAQNEATLARFGGTVHARDRDILAALLDRPDKIAYVGRRGDHSDRSSPHWIMPTIRLPRPWASPADCSSSWRWMIWHWGVERGDGR